MSNQAPERPPPVLPDEDRAGIAPGTGLTAVARIIGVARAVFALAILGVFAYGAIESQSYPELAAQFPFYVCIGGIVMAAIVLTIDVIQLVRARTVLMRELLDAASVFGGVDSRAEVGRVLRATGRCAAWLLGLLGGLRLVGFEIGAPVFLAAFLLLEGKVRPWKAAVAAVLLTGALWLVSTLAGMGLPGAFWQSEFR